MTRLFLIVAMAAVATPQESAPTKERTTYIITTPDGKLPVFWDDAQVQTDADWVRVEVDEPWAPRIWQGKQSSVTVEGRERKTAHEERIKKGYEEHGYVQVNGSFIAQAEVELAERARKMAGLNAPSSTSSAKESGIAQTASVSVESESVPDSPPGLLNRWGAHAGIVVIAGLLLALTGRTLLRG